MNMATNPKVLPAWLTIDLACHQSGATVTFTITFSNTHQVAQAFAFSNRAHKAELLGLVIEDATGQRVMPKHHLMIRPLRPDPDKHLLEGGATLSYEMKGNIVDDYLEFPGALFELQRGSTYQVCFRYHGVRSNKVSFTA